MAKGRVPKLTLGDRLMLAREHAHITSSDMARHLKCSRHTVTNYERGRTEPSHAVILEWSRITRYDLGWLLDGQIEVEAEEATTPATGMSREELAQLLVAQLLGEQRPGLSVAEYELGPIDLREPTVVRHLAPTG